jgi:hypothetical protein
VRASLELTHAKTPVILVSSRKGQGLGELWHCMMESPVVGRAAHSLEMLARRVLMIVEDHLKEWAKKPDEEMRSLAAAWRQHRLSAEEITRTLCRRIARIS